MEDIQSLNEFILDDNTNEEFELECEDEPLPSFDQVEQYVDDDILIQFTDEQYISQLVNILTYNVKNIEIQKGKWIRLAKQYLSILSSLQNKQIDTNERLFLNPKVIPIIEGKKLLMVKSKETNEEDSDIQFITENEYWDNMDFDYNTTLEQKIYRERVWKNNDDDIIIANDTLGKLYSEDYDQYVQILGEMIWTRFTGQKVKVKGFLYRIHDHQKPEIVFDPVTYIESLEKLTINQTVTLLCNTNGYIGKVKIIDINSERIVVNSSLGDISISKKDIHKNTHFIYDHLLVKKEDMYCKASVRDKNVMMYILPDDKHYHKTLELLIPSYSEILSLFENQIVPQCFNLQDFNEIFERYGLDSENVEKDTELLNKTLTNIVNNYKTESKKQVKQKNFRKVMKETFWNKHIYDLNDLKQKLDMYDYKSFPLPNRLCDTEYYRMKFYTEQGDNGYIFYTRFILSFMESLYHHIDKNLVKYKNLQKEYEKNLKEIDHHIKQLECDVKHNVKKSYKSLDKLEKDNYKKIKDIEIGDWCVLQFQNQETYYKRISTNINGESQELWLKMNVESEQCAQDTLEDSVMLKKNRQYYLQRAQYRHHHFAIKNLENAIEFHKNYGLHTQSLAQKCLNIAKSSSKNFSYSMSYTTGEDYTDYVGTLDVELEQDIQEIAEQIDGLQYSSMKAKSFIETISETDKDVLDSMSSDELMVNTLIKLFGIKLDKPQELYISSYLSYAVPDSKYKKQYEMLVKTLKNNPKFKTNYKDIAKKQSQRVNNGEKILIACALYVIFIQIKGVELDKIYFNCTKEYSINFNKDATKNIFNYLACVVKDYAQNDNMNIIYGKFASETQTVHKIQTEIAQHYEKLKSTHPFKTLLETPKGDTTATEQYTSYKEWNSFKPFNNLKGSDTLIGNFMYALQQVIEHQLQNKKNGQIYEELSYGIKAMNSYLSNPTVKKLYTDKISKLNTEKDVPNSFSYYDEDKTLKPTTDLFKSKDINNVHVYIIDKTKEGKNDKLKIKDEVLREAIKNLFNNDKNEEYWQEFSEKVASMYENLYDFIEIQKETKEIYEQYARQVTNKYLLQTRNSYANFLYHTLKMIYARISNRWKLPVVSKKLYNWHRYLSKRTNDMEKLEKIYTSQSINDILGEFELFDPRLLEILSECLQDIVKELLTKEIKVYHEDTDSLRKNVSVYNYILMKSVYTILSVVNKGDDIYDTSTIECTIKSKDILSKFVNYIFKSFVEHMNTNNFVASDIIHSQEKLREGRKEASIRKLEAHRKAYGEEATQAFLAAKNLNIVSLDDLEEEIYEDSNENIKNNEIVEEDTEMNIKGLDEDDLNDDMDGDNEITYYD